MKPATIAIHGGYETDPTTRSVAVPIYQTATFHAQDVDDYAALVGFERPGYTYSRLENPTAEAMAGAFAELLFYWHWISSRAWSACSGDSALPCQ